MESEFIQWLRQRVPKHPRLLLGPGDDAAILHLTEQADCVLTVDMLMDGVDFLLDQHDARLVGRKALAVNLSDLAAMAAKPIAALVSICLPRIGALELACRLLDGMLPLAEQFDLAIAGGDTSVWDGPLVIDITAVGETVGGRRLLRSGAHPGDAVLVTGEFGGSLAGRHFEFVPRVREALQLNASFPLTAGTDVSDGLSLDLSHIASESGCGALLDFQSIPISHAAHRMSAEQAEGPSAIERALSDGEDFELILAAPAETAEQILAEQPCETPITRIGTFIHEPGLWRQADNGGLVAVPPRGYRHG